MNKNWLTLFMETGSMIIFLIQNAESSVHTLQHDAASQNISETKEKPDNLQQRSDEIILLDEHLKTNNLLQKHLASNEKLLNKHLTLNLQNPELNFNRDLKSELFSDKELSFNPDERKEHPGILSFSHLISPHLKDDDFEIERPILGPELAQKYQRELHETLKAHHQNLHQALKEKQNNLHHTMNKHHSQNAQNYNLNNFGEHTSISSGPNEETLYQNDHVSYNHENSRPQNENTYTPPQSIPISSYGEQGHDYQVNNNPVTSNGYERPNPNNVHNHANVYIKTEEPQKGVKSNIYSSKEYYYENQKVQKPILHQNQYTGYGTRDTVGNIGNNNLNSNYPTNAYQSDTQYNHNDKMTPTQYSLNQNLQMSNKQYNRDPLSYQNDKSNYKQNNHGSGNANFNTNYQSGYNYAPHNEPVHNNKNNEQSYRPNPYHGHDNQGPQSYSVNTEINNSKYDKNSNGYRQGYGNEGKNLAYKDIPNSNYNQNKGLKNNIPQIYNSNNGHPHGMQNSDSYSNDPNSVHMNGPNQKNQGNSHGMRYGYNQKENQPNFHQGQNNNNQINNNQMYKSGKIQSGYIRGPPIDNRNRHNVPVYQSKSNPDRGNPNSNLPHHPNMNKYNGKNLRNSYSAIPGNKSPHVTRGQTSSNLKSDNLRNIGPYSGNPSRQSYPQNMNSNKGSVNPLKNYPSSPMNFNNRAGYEKSSFLSRKENPLKVPVNNNSPNVMNAPIIHEIYMAEPLMKQDDMFLAGIF